MSSPIHSLLADELNVSEERAEKLLIAMLREVRKRAHREGVRLPDLGTFREDNGRLTFEPTPSLARAVNHQYEGLPSEDLPTEESSDEEEKDEGPSTAILGTDSDGWSPIESSSAEESKEDTEDPSDADTEEFQIPSPEETADTEEFQAPESTTAKEQDPDSESSDSSSEAEDLYPLVEEATEPEAEEESPSSETMPFGEDDSSQEDLGEIWRSDPEPTNDRESEEAESPSSTPSSSQPSVSDSPSEPPTDSPSSESTGVPRILPLLLLLVLLGGAGWYVLGQRGTLPPPATVLAGVAGQVQETVQSVPLLESSSPPSQETEDEAASPSQEASTSEDSEGDQNEPSASGAPSTDSDNSETPPPPGIDREAGGWTIVVASRTDQATAESLVTTFRDRFEAASVPVDVVTGEVNNTTRYRVAVGQYRTRNEAQQAMNEFGDELPEGAWPLRLR